jgi:hypothetical protein
VEVVLGTNYFSVGAAVPFDQSYARVVAGKSTVARHIEIRLECQTRFVMAQKEIRSQRINLDQVPSSFWQQDSQDSISVFDDTPSLPCLLVSLWSRVCLASSWRQLDQRKIGPEFEAAEVGISETRPVGFLVGDDTWFPGYAAEDAQMV